MDRSGERLWHARGKEPAVTTQYDLLVIGTGTAASTAAHKARGAGKTVAVIDSRAFGGTCALRGCDPKKVLVGAAELVDWHRRLAAKGIVTGEVKIDWPSLMRFKKSFTDPVPKSREDSFSKAGIDTYHGRAHFVAERTVQVAELQLTGRFVLIATGAAPVKLGIRGEEFISTSDQFLELERLPKRIVFIGGGYISFEFAHIAARAGAEVCLVHRSSRPLKGFDPDLVDQLVRATAEIGVQLRLEEEVTGIEKRNGQLEVFTSAAGERPLEADLVVHGAGRVPQLEDLQLSNAGIKSDPRKGILVNEYLQSVSNSAVYAAGDVAATDGLPLTPVAGMEGKIVASNLLEGNSTTANYKGIPSVVFSIPPLASVGMDEASAKAAGLKFRVKQEESSAWYTSRRVAEEHTGYKTLVEEGSERILGAHVLGPHAEEVINVFALAIREGIPAGKIGSTIYAYPTSGSDIAYMV